jgi:Zn-dependent protease with chaperone function
MIFVTTAMMQALQSENELAFILGHEFGHFKHKDHLRRLGYGLILSTVAMMLGDTGSLGVNSVLDFGNASYSRAAEEAADLYGLDAMQCAYGSVTDATAYFERMAKTAKWQGFMADHPGFTERIAAMRARIADAGMDTTIPAMPLPAE